MYIDDFIWLPDVVEKLAVKHHVTPDEVEEVFFNRRNYLPTRVIASRRRRRSNLQACGEIASAALAASQ